MKAIVILALLVGFCCCGVPLIKCPNLNPGQCKLSDAESRTALDASGVMIESPGNCSDWLNTSCTSLEHINCASIDQVNGFKSYSGCAVTIIGGTEVGHAYGDFSHENGYKLDLKMTACIDEYVKTHMTHIGGNVYRSGAGNFYYREDDSHYDVTFCVSSGMGFSDTVPCSYKNVSGTCQKQWHCPIAGATIEMGATGCEQFGVPTTDTLCCIPYPCTFNGIHGTCAAFCDHGIDIAGNRGAEGCEEFASNQRCCIGCCEPEERHVMHDSNYTLSQDKFLLCCNGLQSGAPYTCDDLSSACACAGFYSHEGTSPIANQTNSPRGLEKPYFVHLNGFCEGCADQASHASVVAVTLSLFVLIFVMSLL